MNLTFYDLIRIITTFQLLLVFEQPGLTGNRRKLESMFCLENKRDLKGLRRPLRSLRLHYLINTIRFVWLNFPALIR
jgi:hypothetical protein